MSKVFEEYLLKKMIQKQTEQEGKGKKLTQINIFFKDLAERFPELIIDPNFKHEPRLQTH